jgi:hypothetical protein
VQVNAAKYPFVNPVSGGFRLFFLLRLHRIDDLPKTVLMFEIGQSGIMMPEGQWAG